MSGVNRGPLAAVISSISKKDSTMTKLTHSLDRRHFIGGSDARVIMGKDEKALHRLWREKRGEAAAPDLVGRPDRPTRAGHRGPQPPLV
jgi:hypothetical protein